MLLLHKRSHFKTTASALSSLKIQCASRPLSPIKFSVNNSKRVLSLKFEGARIFDRNAFENFKVSR